MLPNPAEILAFGIEALGGNPLFGPGSTICPHDWYAYSAFSKKWELSLEDSKGFALEMYGRIRDLPLPDKGKIRSRVVYSQSIDGDVVVHSVLFWCDTDQRYLDRLDEYAKRAGVRVKIERERIPGQTYARAEVETKRKPAVKNPTNKEQPQVLEGPDGGRSLMKMVSPRIIIQEEEEEKMGVGHYSPAMSRSESNSERPRPTHSRPSPHHLLARFRNCLAHSVSQITIKIISHKTNLRNTMAQNQTCWTKGQSVPGPHMDKSHAGRADMTTR